MLQEKGDELSATQKLASWTECNIKEIGIVCGIIFFVDIIIQMCLRPWSDPEVLGKQTYWSWFFKADNLNEIAVNFVSGLKDMTGWTVNPVVPFVIKPLTHGIRKCCDFKDKSLSNEADRMHHPPPKIVGVDIGLSKSQKNKMSSLNPEVPKGESYREKINTCCGNQPCGCCFVFWGFIMFVATIVNIVKDFGVAELTKMAYKDGKINATGQLLQPAVATSSLPYPTATNMPLSALNPAAPVSECKLFGLNSLLLAHYDNVIQCKDAAPGFDEGQTTTIMRVCAWIFVAHAVISFLEGAMKFCTFSANNWFEIAGAITCVNALGLGAVQSVLGRLAKPIVWSSRMMMKMKQAKKHAKDVQDNFDKIKNLF